MRSHTAGLLALGLVLSLTVVGPPAAAGCSSIFAQPTGCATAVYNSAKANAQAKVGAAGGYAAAFPGYAAACGQVPEVGLDLPGLPAVPALPGSAPAAAWSGAMQGHVSQFREVAGVNSIGPAAAALFHSGYESTLAMVLFYSDASDAILLAFIPDTLPTSPEQLPAPPQPGAPELPDASAGAEAGLAWAGDHAAAAQGAALTTAGCVQAIPRL